MRVGADAMHQPLPRWAVQNEQCASQHGVCSSAGSQIFEIGWQLERKGCMAGLAALHELTATHVDNSVCGMLCALQM